MLGRRVENWDLWPKCLDFFTAAIRSRPGALPRQFIATGISRISVVSLISSIRWKNIPFQFSETFEKYEESDWNFLKCRPRKTATLFYLSDIFFPVRKNTAATTFRNSSEAPDPTFNVYTPILFSVIIPHLTSEYLNPARDHYLRWFLDSWNLKWNLVRLMFAHNLSILRRFECISTPKDNFPILILSISDVLYLCVASNRSGSKVCVMELLWGCRDLLRHPSQFICVPLIIFSVSINGFTLN